MENVEGVKKKSKEKENRYGKRIRIIIQLMGCPFSLIIVNRIQRVL